MPPPDEYTCELCQRKFSQAQTMMICVDREKYKYGLACKPCAIASIKTEFVCLIMTSIISFVYAHVFGIETNPTAQKSNIKPPLIENSQVYIRSAGKRK